LGGGGEGIVVKRRPFPPVTTFGGEKSPTFGNKTRGKHHFKNGIQNFGTLFV